MPQVLQGLKEGDPAARSINGFRVRQLATADWEELEPTGVHRETPLLGGFKLQCPDYFPYPPPDILKSNIELDRELDSWCTVHQGFDQNLIDTHLSRFEEENRLLANTIKENIERGNYLADEVAEAKQTVKQLSDQFEHICTVPIPKMKRPQRDLRLANLSEMRKKAEERLVETQREYSEFLCASLKVVEKTLRWDVGVPKATQELRAREHQSQMAEEKFTKLGIATAMMGLYGTVKDQDHATYTMIMRITRFIVDTKMKACGMTPGLIETTAGVTILRDNLDFLVSDLPEWFKLIDDNKVFPIHGETSWERLKNLLAAAADVFSAAQEKKGGDEQRTTVEHPDLVPQNDPDGCVAYAPNIISEIIKARAKECENSRRYVGHQLRHDDEMMKQEWEERKLRREGNGYSITELLCDGGVNDLNYLPPATRPEISDIDHAFHLLDTLPHLSNSIPAHEPSTSSQAAGVLSALPHLSDSIPAQEPLTSSQAAGGLSARDSLLQIQQRLGGPSEDKKRPLGERTGSGFFSTLVGSFHESRFSPRRLSWDIKFLSKGQATTEDSSQFPSADAGLSHQPGVKTAGPSNAHRRPDPPPQADDSLSRDDYQPTFTQTKPVWIPQRKGTPIDDELIHGHRADENSEAGLSLPPVHNAAASQIFLMEEIDTHPPSPRAGLSEPRHHPAPPPPEAGLSKPRRRPAPPPQADDPLSHGNGLPTSALIRPMRMPQRQGTSIADDVIHGRQADDSNETGPSQAVPPPPRSAMARPGHSRKGKSVSWME
ncbi:hypothetical protein N0V88_003107 [Collariella sp. IMI 366227]|nr:hypothetical protein N0V88_003107 [Collariella sp. IMI 366227]